MVSSELGLLSIYLPLSERIFSSSQQAGCELQRAKASPQVTKSWRVKVLGRYWRRLERRLYARSWLLWCLLCSQVTSGCECELSRQSRQMCQVLIAILSVCSLVPGTRTTSLFELDPWTPYSIGLFRVSSLSATPASQKLTPYLVPTAEVLTRVLDRKGWSKRKRGMAGFSKHPQYFLNKNLVE